MTHLQLTVEQYRSWGYGIYRRILGTEDPTDVRRLKNLHPTTAAHYHNYVNENGVRNAIRELRAKYGPMVAIVEKPTIFRVIHRVLSTKESVTC